MIQGVHASSLLFAGFAGVPDAIARLGGQLPGIEAAGHAITLHGSDFTLRLGPARKEKGYLVTNLHMGLKETPFQAQLDGVLSFHEATTRSRTTVTFDGRCARTFGGQNSGETTEAVRRVANEACRTVLQVLVTAIERSATAGEQVGATVRAQGASASSRRATAAK
jgi:hypothetical protein